MFCPRCKTVALKQGQVKNKNICIDYCPQCKGIWFDAGELEDVSPLAAKDLRLQDDAPKGDCICPKCTRPLYTFEYPQTLVTIDMCKSCKGIWLDARELKEIEAVRKDLHQKGWLQEYADIPGIKGWLIRHINDIIDEYSFTLFE